MMPKKKTNKKAKTPKIRNWTAVSAFLRGGAGAHSPKKYVRKVKHKGKESY